MWVETDEVGSWEVFTRRVTERMEGWTKWSRGLGRDRWTIDRRGNPQRLRPPSSTPQPSTEDEETSLLHDLNLPVMVCTPLQMPTLPSLLLSILLDQTTNEAPPLPSSELSRSPQDRHLQGLPSTLGRAQTSTGLFLEEGRVPSRSLELRVRRRRRASRRERALEF